MNDKLIAQKVTIVTSVYDFSGNRWANFGSLGKPKNGDPRGGYVTITINDNTAVGDKDSIQVEFIRFEYDVEKAAKAVEDSLLPNEYAEMLRKGF